MSAQDFLDAETRAAVDALVHRLQNRGEADDEPFAVEYVTALKGRGWRPTLAVPSPRWKDYGQGDATTPEQGGEGAAAYLAVKAEILARRTGPQPALRVEATETTGTVPGNRTD